MDSSWNRRGARRAMLTYDHTRSYSTMANVAPSSYPATTGSVPASHKVNPPEVLEPVRCRGRIDRGTCEVVADRCCRCAAIPSPSPRRLTTPTIIAGAILKGCYASRYVLERTILAAAVLIVGVGAAAFALVTYVWY
jgi:hypothetical protein